MMTSSITVTLAGDSSSKGLYPNSYPGSSSGRLMLSSNSISLLNVSARTFFVPAINSKLIFWDSSSTAQLFTFAFARSHKSRAAVDYTLIGVEPQGPTRDVWPIATVTNDSQLHLVASSI